MRRSLALLLVISLASGCLQPLSSGTPAPSAPTLEPATWPKIDAAATLTDLRLFSELHPGRQYESKTHVDSRTWLEGAMKSAGLEVVRQRFPARTAGPNGVYSGENIIGIHWGTDRSEWIVVGAHYDVTDLAVHGTYDDGSGTLMTIKLAQAFAKVPTNRTIAFILFDQEEMGLVGSAHFVQSLLDNKFIHRASVVAMVDLDMVGITYPHPAPLVCLENSDELKRLTESARKDANVPDGQMQYRRPRGGSSDAMSFLGKGIPTIYCWSNWDEVVLKDGTKMQGSYPWWHRGDTYSTMLAIAGDEATLRGGFQTVLDIVSPVVANSARGGFFIDTR